MATRQIDKKNETQICFPVDINFYLEYVKVHITFMRKLLYMKFEGGSLG